MTFTSFDGLEKIYCYTGSPSIEDKIKAFRLAKDKGLTHYAVAYFPGSISCITLHNKSSAGFNPIGGLFDDLMKHYDYIKMAREQADKNQALLDDFFQQGVSS